MKNGGSYARQYYMLPYDVIVKALSTKYSILFRGYTDSLPIIINVYKYNMLCKRRYKIPGSHSTPR